MTRIFFHRVLHWIDLVARIPENVSAFSHLALFALEKILASKKTRVRSSRALWGTVRELWRTGTLFPRSQIIIWETGTCSLVPPEVGKLREPRTFVPMFPWNQGNKGTLFPCSHKIIWGTGTCSLVPPEIGKLREPRTLMPMFKKKQGNKGTLMPMFP